MLKALSYDFDKAFEIAHKVFNYTNHTIMAEALEKWDCRLVEKVVPEVYTYILMINERFIKDMYALKKDREYISKLSPVGDGMVKMAFMAIYVSSYINGSTDGLTFTGAIKCKKLTIEIPLTAGQTVTVYYCGSDSGVTSAKDLEMTVFDPSGAAVAVDENVSERSGFAAYSVSYTAQTAGTYKIYDASTANNRTLVYGVTVK